MDFSLSEDPLAIREGVAAVLRAFGDDYWLTRDEDGEFPHAFHRAMADAGWLGITMPVQQGGAGLGVTEAAIMMHEVASHANPERLLIGAEANAAKSLGARAGHDACQQAVMTHGSFGYAKKYHIERLLREVMIMRLAPVGEQMILSFIAEKVLDLPRSY